MQTLWEVLLRPLLWPELQGGTPAGQSLLHPGRAPRPLTTLAPQGWMPGNHGHSSPCLWVCSVPLTMWGRGETNSKMCTHKELKNPS